MGQRLPAQPAQRQYQQRAARDPAMGRLKFGNRRVGQHLDGRFGDPSIARRNLQRVVPALDQLDAERKAFFTDPRAHAVEQYLIIVARFGTGKLFGQFFDRWRQIESGRIDQAVEQFRAPRQRIREHRRVAENIAQHFEQGGPRLQ